MMYALIGLLSGVVSGLGIGGGTILIPALCILFDMGQKEAQNINLIYFIPTAIMAIVTHAKAGNIEKKVISPLVWFGLAAAAAGSFIAISMNPETLRRLFGFFLLAMGAMEIFRKEENTKETT